VNERVNSECEVATHIGPESCGAARGGRRRSVDRGNVRAGYSVRVRESLRDVFDAVGECGRPHPVHRYRGGCQRQGPAAVTDPVHVRNHLEREPGEIPGVARHSRLPWDASGSLRTYADDERIWEVGQTYCTGESP